MNEGKPQSQSEPDGPRGTEGAAVFAIELVAVPGRVPGIVRLRRALKCFLRAYGLRCVSVRENLPGKQARVADREAGELFRQMREAAS